MDDLDYRAQPPVSFNTLPLELANQIIGIFLDQKRHQGFRLARFACVNRVFQFAVEQRTFGFHGHDHRSRTLRLSPRDMGQFQRIYAWPHFPYSAHAYWIRRKRAMHLKESSRSGSR